MKEEILKVGFNKYGEFDFSISGRILEFDYEKMKGFRSMVISAIGTFEDMWRSEQERKDPPQCEVSK